jgi:hypothetical protein
LDKEANYKLETTREEIEKDPLIWEKKMNHIYQTHFDQMQLGMAVLRKPWADYLVYAKDGIYSERIPYCHGYFINRLLTPTREFLDQKLDPILEPGWRSSLPPISELNV